MNFQTMDYFVAVAEERSFTRAAGLMHVSQQTLSASVAAAERELASHCGANNEPTEENAG